MIYFIATFVFFLLFMVAMAIGYFFNKKSITGSCGGLASLGIDKECDCPEPCDSRIKKNKEMAEETRLAKLKKQQRIV
jgi:hypothetical protein